jgi:hypothetical protein
MLVDMEKAVCYRDLLQDVEGSSFGLHLNILFDTLVHVHKGLSLLSKNIISKEFSSYSAEIDISRSYFLGNNVRFYMCQTSERLSRSEFLMLFRYHFNLVGI